MKAPVVVSLVVAVHAGAIGLLLLAPGCGTRTPRTERPVAPVMPPEATRVPPVEPARPPIAPPDRPRPVPERPPRVEPPGLGTYTVRGGDTLSGIAARLGVSRRELIELNAIRNPDVIVVGQKLLVPGYEGEITPPPRAERPPRETPAAPGADHVVQAGETLSHLAVRYGVSVAAIREANRLPGDMIRVGQTLRIPGAAEPRPTPTPTPDPAPEPEPAPPEPEPEPVEEAEPRLGEGEPFYYTLSEGESIEDVARLFLLSVEDLMRANRITDPAQVRPGQRIQIPAGL